MEERKKYDLEERTLVFLKSVISFLRTVKKDYVNVELGKQLIRSTGSVGANYREANEAVSKKDFAFRIRICRKEAKESSFWFSAYECDNELEDKRKALLQEATELSKIFGSMVKKLEEKGF
ncbi:MAG: S23 ribosomal protein [Ignavibacteria bacterium]|nr:MAG: S23 ribosomal protein [Ignavibacteria bacterium]